jgi:FkbM family methyltransferase
MDGARTMLRAVRMPLLYRNVTTAYRNRAMPYVSGGRRDVSYRLWNGTVVHGTDGREEVRIINEIWIDRCYASPGFVPEPGWSVLDVGANKGIFALWALHEAKNDLRLACYEPSPSSFRYLQRNVGSQVAGDMLRNCAVGATEGDVTLYELVGRSGESSLSQSRAATTGNEIVETTVPKVTLADVIADLGSIDLLKVDVEGAEYEIVADSPSGAFTGVRRIVLEFDAVEKRPESPRSAEDLFRAVFLAGFKMRRRGEHVAFLSR